MMIFLEDIATGETFLTCAGAMIATETMRIEAEIHRRPSNDRYYAVVTANGHNLRFFHPDHGWDSESDAVRYVRMHWRKERRAPHFSPIPFDPRWLKGE